MVISYDEDAKEIVATGGEAEDPITLSDIYNADVAGGWGVVTNPEPLVYRFKVRLQIGDGDEQTYFASSDNNIYFDVSVLEIKPKATVVLEKF